MRINKSIFFVFAAFSIAFVLSTSCKKCVTAEQDTNTGLIITDVNVALEEQVIIYPSIGYSATSVYGGPCIVTGPSTFVTYEVSFDGGKTKQPVNFNSYSLLSLPQNINCHASFARDISVNTILNTVTYSVTASVCPSCEQQYHVENWVLVPKSSIPGGYSIIFDGDIVEL